MYLRQGAPHAWSFVPVTTRRLTVQRNITSGGAPTANQSILEEDQTTQINANPNEGYRFLMWELTGANSQVANATSQTTTFTMGTGTADVIVTAVFIGELVSTESSLLEVTF